MLISSLRRFAAVLAALFFAFGAAVQAQSPAPRINPGGVTEAAQFLQMVAPGSIATLFGQELAGEVLEAESIPLPLELGGVRVEVNGVPAPLYFVSSGQINFQIPFETELGEARVVVIRDGVSSEPENVDVKAYVPAAFRNAATGEAIVVASGSAQLINAENPAVAGQIVTVFLNGYGRLDFPPATGAAAPVDPLARTLAVPRVRLGDQEVTVYYAGLTPGLVGLGQLDLGLPAELPGSLRTTLPLTIDFGEFAASVEDLPVVLPEPPAPDVGIEITGLTPQTVMPGGSFRVDYRLVTPTGYSGQADVSFFLQFGSSFATLEQFTVELSGFDVALSRELTARESLFPGSYSFQGSVEIPGDGNSANDRFVLEQPFVIEAAGGDPHDIGVEVTSVTPMEIAAGDPLTFAYTLLNLTGYSGPVDVAFQLSTSVSGRVLLTEQVMLEGAEREIVRQVATPENLPPDSYRPLMRVRIENDTDPSNNTGLSGTSIVVGAPAQLAPTNGPFGDPPPIGDLTEGNLSEWALEAYRGKLPASPGVRLGQGAMPVTGSSFLTGVAPSADRLILRYPRPAALAVSWDLSNHQALELWMSLGSNTSLRQGRPRVVLLSAAGSRTLTPEQPQDLSSLLFERYRVPLAGAADWTVSEEGAFDLRRVTGFELDFQFDKPGAITVNLDGVRLEQ